MQVGFQKFKNKQTCVTIINSLIWGIAAALLSVGGLLLVHKLFHQDIYGWLYGVVPSAAAVLAAGIAYLIFATKDKNLAREIDEKFVLNDRTQTMLEFEGQKSSMIRLQREDAHARLNELSPSKLRWKGLWACLLPFVCAVAVFVTGLAIPKKVKADDNTNNPPPPPPPTFVFEITDKQIMELATLIRNVKNSNAEDVIKAPIVAELETLLNALSEEDLTKKIDTAEELYPELSRIIMVIDELVEDHNTYKRVYETLHASEVETVRAFALGIGLNDMLMVSDSLPPMFENEEKSKVMVLEAVQLFATEMATRVALLEESEEDALMMALSQFIAEAETVAALNPEDYTYEKILDPKLDTLMSNTVLPFNTALTQQTDNRKTVSDTIERLIVIFKLPMDWIPDWGGKNLTGLDGEGDNAESDMSTAPGEGIIVDGIQYPSNETVYDYYTKKICAYGKVFQNEAHNYKSAITMLIAEGVEDGTIDAEMEEMLRKYLDKISGNPIDEKA